MLRSKRALGAGLLAAALAVGTGWVVRADANDVTTDNPPARDSAAAVQAVDGYQLVTLPNADVPNFRRRTVHCPTGKKALGGGAEVQGNEAVLTGSFPTPDGRGWVGVGRQNAYGTVGISVYVICANA
ncbi:hypothetical protein ACF9IK_10975 [Kitasatospora hibisci]|uniref:hypothetical protein n=1 Tax=Kitasatospora hibisci TaxID=3369522 RepID=UPI0037546DC0